MKEEMTGVGWESLDSYSALLDGRSVGWVSYGENSVLVVGVTSWPLSEKVIGELVDSETAFISSRHALKYTY